MRASLTLAALVGVLLPPDIISRSAARAAEASSEATRMETYADAKGDHYFALSLRPTIAADANRPHEIVVLVDTSASQAGDYRRNSLSALDAYLAGLQPTDRVRLLAVDVNALPLTETFVSVDSPEMKAAIEKLHRRVPLGSTDMVTALQATIDSFGADNGADREAIYIGDGISTGGFVGTEDARRLIGGLVERQVPFSSFAVGPKTDGVFLAALANQTGGVLAIDGDQVTPLQVGRYLASATHETVAWPKQVQWPAEFVQVYPNQLPPLRGDRDTIVIGTKAGDQAKFNVAVTADIDGRAVEFLFDAEDSAPSDDNAYLATLVDAARADGGLSLPTVGSEGLKQTHVMLQLAVHNLNKLGANARNTGNFGQAAQLAQAALAIDPNNDVAQAVHRDAQAGEKQLRLVADTNEPNEAAVAQVPLRDQPLRGDGDGVSVGGGEAAVDPDGAFLDTFARERQIMAQKTEADVLNALNDARTTMQVDPQAAIDNLKLMRQQVDSSPDLDPTLRTQLLSQIESALRDAATRHIVHEEEIVNRGQLAAAAAERERVLNELFLRDQKLEQLMARFDSLMHEERYFDAEQVAFIARDISPSNPVMTSAVLTSRTAGYFAESAALREARHRGVVDMLASAERSHVPTSDEPPILYPDPEVWQALTERRKQWKQVDLAQSGPAEERILSALDEPTELEFIETPLSDVIEYLKDRHKIEIQIDKKALEDAGVTSDTPVTWNLRGIKLKSALKLMLGELELTYVIENEVLSITTSEEANSTLKTKVYPVADLVLPIPRIALGAAGSGGGGFGGAGGGLGGGGGGGGGGLGGGGGGGGFGGGGGGGMF
jgi:hypothetical protein